jgi:16S rRNA (cytosine1402-N4)-methyltransferase
LALKIIERRQSEPFKKVCDLLSVIGSKRKIGKKIHPATKVFLALRIAVNSEYENLNESLIKAFDLLKVGGRLVVISFHSGEDRIVKNIFKARCFDDKAKLLTKKPIIPTLNEVSENPRARSAKLRVIEKI